MEQIPFYVYVTFIFALLVSVGLFYAAAHKSKLTLIIIAIWLIAQGFISFSGFYTITGTTPPRVAFLLVPPLLTILLLFTNQKGKRFIDSLNMKYLTLIHIVRIPVEFVLLWLAFRKAIPQIMTFEGRNFDILSGISAPIIFYFFFTRKTLSRNLFIVWNLICLCLLINIVTIAILAMPTPFQQIAFDQPNIGVLYFPFTWLPGIIVPLVLLSHLATIRQLVKHNN